MPAVLRARAQAPINAGSSIFRTAKVDVPSAHQFSKRGPCAAETVANRGLRHVEHLRDFGTGNPFNQVGFSEHLFVQRQAFYGELETLDTAAQICTHAFNVTNCGTSLMLGFRYRFPGLLDQIIDVLRACFVGKKRLMDS